MYRVSAQGFDELMVNVHYYYYKTRLGPAPQLRSVNDGTAIGRCRSGLVRVTYVFRALV